MSLDLSGDWIVFDNTQTISYYSRINDTTYATPTSVVALKREDKKAWLEDNGFEYSEHQCIWEVWKATFGVPTVCKRGDKFVALTVTGSQTWIVERCDYCDFTTRFRLHCYQKDMGS